MLPHPYMYIAYTARSFNSNNHKLLYSLYNSPQDTCNGASAPLLGVERRNTQIHAETAQAAMSSRSIVANTYQRDLVPHPNIHRQPSNGSQAVDVRGANSSNIIARNLAGCGRFTKLDQGNEERAAAINPETRRQTHSEVSLEAPDSAGNRAGQGSLQGGLAWKHRHLWCSKADIHPPKSEKEMITSTASEASMAIAGHH